MSVQSFHYVQQQMERHFDMINQEKKKVRQWSKRLHLALLAYRELLLTICAMDKSAIDSVKHSAKVIKSNIFYVLEYRELVLTLLVTFDDIFYVLEYRELVLTLLVTFDELKMSGAYLNDLIECQHIFLKMLQTYCGGGNSGVMVQKRGRAKKKSKKANEGRRPASEVGHDSAAKTSESDLANRWDEVGPQLSVVLDGRAEIPDDLVPFDATSDVPIDEQKSKAMKNIQHKLRNNEFEQAVGLLRASREVWPENDCFGSNNMPPEEEFLALRDIFFADLGGCQGRISDGRVFKQTQLSKNIENNQLQIPREAALPGKTKVIIENNQLQIPREAALPGKTKVIPYVFVGDEAFALGKNFHFLEHTAKVPLKEFLIIDSAKQEELLKMCISSAIFRVLRKPMLLEPQKAGLIVMLVVYLRNFLPSDKESRLLYSPPGTFDHYENGNLLPGTWRASVDEEVTSLLPIRNVPRRSLNAKAIRDEFVEYFTTDGWVPWQNKFA
ncbi:hypothetical protein QE152_g29405 [Popillia japonica]|uniref:Uncharacterized protein n=1 Tax=Popillia japonica TaxID=7064 RepID=A0AAW1JHN8_POPJA